VRLPSAEPRNFLPTDEEREEVHEGRNECEAWQREYAAALAETRVYSANRGTQQWG
jgi:hypothetical protein